MKWRYVGYETSGTPKRGTIEAADEAAARDTLHQQGVIVLEIAEDTGKPRARQRIKGPRGKLGDISQFMRHMSVLIASGTPLSEGVEAMAGQTRDEKFKAVLERIQAEIESGTPLSDAMAAHPGYFDDVCRAMVAAGETSGRLGDMLERVASLMRQKLAMRRAIVGAMIYPCILIGIGIIVVLVMLVMVFPRFEEMFESLDTPIPPSTQMFLWISTMLRQYWWIWLAAIVPAALLVRFVLRHPTTSRSIDRMLLRAPKIGEIARSIASARLARMVSLLLESHLPLLDVLSLCAGSMRSPEYATLLNQAHDAAEAGQPISTVIEEADLLHGLVREGVRTGERTGRMGMMLGNVADFLEEENEATLKALSAIIEPLLLVTLGIIVGGIATSMFLPLFDLTASAGAQ
ncbi:MAG: type II secretion system F family protein [Phycisphaerales bacterium JB060]